MAFELCVGEWKLGEGLFEFKRSYTMSQCCAGRRERAMMKGEKEAVKVPRMGR